MEIALNLVIFIASFVAIWFGSGLIIKSVDKISRKLKVSSFAISFFLLGILTSIPEISLSLAALSEGKPEIFVGSLIGGIIVIFFFIIPIFAVLGNGIKLTNKIESTKLIYAFIVLLTPLISVMDKRITVTEGIFIIILAGVLFFTVEKNKGVLDGDNEMLHLKRYSLHDLLKILLGIGLIFGASNLIVDKTIYFGTLLSVPAFFISLIVLSLGTNIPEISLVFRAIKDKKKDVAFGNYLGSGTVNVVIFAVMTLMSGGEVLTVNNFWKTLVIAVVGFATFYHFTKSKHDISRQEGAILLLVYAVFLLVEGLMFL
jgi:cation:H+ antiporter